MGRREQNPRRACGTHSRSKRDHSGEERAANIFRENACASSDMSVCILSAHSPQTSHLDAEDQCTGMAAIMMYAGTKKMYIPLWKYTIMSAAMSLRLVERGLARVAGQSCLAGPSVPPAAPKLRAPPWMGVWYGIQAESQAFFSSAPHFFDPSGPNALWWRCFPPHRSALFLTPSPFSSPCPARAVFCISIVSTRGCTMPGREERAKKEKSKAQYRMRTGIPLPGKHGQDILALPRFW